MKSLGVIPQIDFQYVTDNFVRFWPFNLTATVVSNSNLTSLYWSPPESSDPVPNRTITVHHGNMTTTTLMLLEYGPPGNYTLTAVNECGENSVQVDVEDYALWQVDVEYYAGRSSYNTDKVSTHSVMTGVSVLCAICMTISIILGVTCFVHVCYRRYTQIMPVEDELYGEGKHTVCFNWCNLTVFFLYHSGII